MKKFRSSAFSSTGFVFTIVGIIFLDDYKTFQRVVLVVGIILIVSGLVTEWRKRKLRENDKL